jgi:hypothetical protein
MDRERFRDFTDFRRSLLRQIQVEISNDNFGFFLGEGLGRVLADSLSAAGNDNHFFLEHYSPLNVYDFLSGAIIAIENWIQRRARLRFLLFEFVRSWLR